MTDTTGASPLHGRTALISGSSSGIGAGAALAFARAGAAFVVINYPVEAEAAAAEAVAAKVRSLGAKALAVQADVSDESQAAHLVAAALEAAGRIDILVNNAGIGHGDLVDEMPVATWDRVIGVHLRGTFLLTHAVLPGMYAHGFGRIINTASQLAYKGAPGLSAYTAAKGGVVNLTKSQAIQLAPHKIRVNAVVPNKIGSPVGKDEFDPTRPVVNLRQNRPGVPMDMAKALLFLVSDDADFITGTALFVDGGVTTIMPGNEPGT